MLTVADVIASMLAQALTVSGTVSSDEVYLQAKAPGRSPRHGEVCVGITQSNPEGAARQGGGGVHLATGEAHVLLSWQLSGARLADAVTNPGGEAAWLAIEQSIRVAQLALRTRQFEIRWTGTARSAGAKEWVYSDISFFVIHALPAT